MPGRETRGLQSPWWPFTIMVIGVLVVDALTKAAASRYLGPDQDRRTVEIVPSVLTFAYSQNRGIAFGLLRDNSVAVWVLVALATVGLAALIWTSIGSADPLKSVALGLVAGGGLANLASRVVEGHVVDFIEVSRWPSFNIADASLTAGVILLSVHYLRENAAGTPLDKGRD